MPITTENEEITTIFVVGFPDDMQEREFINIFTFSAGFEAAILKIPSQESGDTEHFGYGRKQIIGFAKFKSRNDATDAKNLLTGKRIDNEKHCILKAEFAKKNLHSKRAESKISNPRESHPSHFLSDIKLHDPFINPTRRSITPSLLSLHPIAPLSLNEFPSDSKDDSLYIHSPPVIPTDMPNPPVFSLDDSQDGGAYFSMRPDSNNNYHDYIDILNTTEFTPPSTASHSRAQSLNNGLLSSHTPDSENNQDQDMNMLNHSVANLQLPDWPPFRSIDQNPPCNTLYVGNLPPNTTPEELEALFVKTKGYRRLCFRNRPSGPMCFVEFEDIHHATMVMYELYGFPLSTHSKGGIRLSYSKNPLGVRLPQGQPPKEDEKMFMHQPHPLLLI